MASTEPESNSEVSAAAETSEEAVSEAGTEMGARTPKPAAATTAPPMAGSAKVTESGAGSSQEAAVVLAAGVIGAEVPAAARVTESTAPTPAPTPDPKAAKEPRAAKAVTASSTPAAEPVAAEKSGPQAVAQPAPAPEPASEPASEPVATAAAGVAEATAATTTASATAAATTSRGLPALTAVLGTLTRSRTRTRTASAATAIATDDSGNGPEGVGAKDEGPAPGKVSRPMVAAAVIGGVVLLSLPFVVASSTGGDGPEHNSRNTGAGYTDAAPGADGYVPQADASKGPLGKGSPKAPGGTAGTTDGVNAPPIIEAASADNVGSSGELPTGTKAGDKAPKDKAGGKTTQTKAGDKTTQTKTGSGSGKQTETKTDPSTGNSAAPAPQKTAASPTVLFSAVGGLHCTNSAVTFTERGKYTDGQKGWTTHDGSYAAGGCNGWYRSIPMSGDSNDSDNSVVWNFRTGDVSSGSCKVSVYIPNDSNIGHVGGQPTYYTVHDGTSTAGSTQLGHFTITQVSHRGQWIAAPSYKINSGVLSVKLHDRGDDWSSSSRANAHHAAAPIRVECTK
ncbi:hypothetical protein ACFWOJ_24960 [Streptomyces sp. NPDC058439]|uniref:hypothetical protein n=1 Tax=Streptomyces sp. NPDC058439 TaxID=3346500 RepID=UPI0036692139